MMPSTKDPTGLLMRMLSTTWRLCTTPIKALWQKTVQRWWNAFITLPLIAGLIAVMATITVADIAAWIGIFVLLGVRAGTVEVFKSIRAKAGR